MVELNYIIYIFFLNIVLIFIVGDNILLTELQPGGVDQILGSNRTEHCSGLALPSLSLSLVSYWRDSGVAWPPAAYSGAGGRVYLSAC